VAALTIFQKLYSFIAVAEVFVYMKKDIHPDNYRLVIFKDNTSGERVLIGSTVETSKTDTWTDGTEYPLKEVDVSSASHPFYTGQERSMDSAGRVERFKARQAKAKGKK
jgi:large subunit ribosomal protein L31